MFQHNDKLYIRVSDILNKISDFQNIPEAVLSRKQKIGTEVHKAINVDINGDFPILDESSVGYFDSFTAWKDSLNIKFVQSEKRYFDDNLMITGQIDALITMNNNDLPILVDFKTSVNESQMAWKMQSHFYSHLLRNDGMEIANFALFVKLDKNGLLPKIYPYTYDTNIFNLCMFHLEEFKKEQNL